MKGKWIAAAAAAGFPIGWAALASVPALLGRETGAGFAGVAQAACALDRDGSAEILVAGDSRAKCQLMPILLADATGKRCVNIAEALPFGGDPATLVNVLRREPALLASHPVLVISVSMPGVNDACLGNVTASELFNFTPADQARLWIRNSSAYPRFFFSRYLPSIKREALHLWRRDGFVCDGDVRLPRALFASRGFRPMDGPIDGGSAGPGKGKPERYLIDGARWRLFRESMRWLAASPAGAVVLYDAPFDPEWVRQARGTAELDAETRFAGKVAREASLYAKFRYMDFLSRPAPELSPGDFHDPYHLNGAGAAKFSRMVAESLKVALRRAEGGV
jgi:hypothetical protein